MPAFEGASHFRLAGCHFIEQSGSNSIGIHTVNNAEAAELVEIESESQATPSTNQATAPSTNQATPSSSQARK